MGVVVIEECEERTRWLRTPRQPAQEFPVDHPRIFLSIHLVERLEQGTQQGAEQAGGRAPTGGHSQIGEQFRPWSPSQAERMRPNRPRA